MTTPAQDARAGRGRKPFWGYGLLVLAVCSLAGTLLFLHTWQFGAESTRRGFGIMAGILGVMLALLVMGGRVLVRLWARRRAASRAGARLHARLVVLLGVSAALPTVLMVVFAAFSFHNGISAWFTRKTRNILDQSMAVANGYLAEQHKVVRSDAELVGQILAPRLAALEEDPWQFQESLERLLEVRSLEEGMVLDEHLHILACSRLTLTLQFDVLSSSDLQQARIAPVIRTSDAGDRLRALVALPCDPVRYLYVGRFVDAGILGYLEQTSGAVAEYRAMNEHQGRVVLLLVLVMVMAGGLIVLASVGVAFVVADQVIQPVRSLMAAARQVRAGHMDVRASTGLRGRAWAWELGLLVRTFNRMVRRIAWQQNALQESNQALEERGNLLQTVLSGVRSGVVGLDPNQCIRWPNPAASDILGVDMASRSGVPLVQVVPEFQTVLERVQQGTSPFVQEDVVRQGVAGSQVLFVRVARQEGQTGKAGGYVVTFNDMTNILKVERQAAWSDAARRVAHEIRNPLTPIRLAAERLQRRIRTTEPEDALLVQQCTGTIVRQVETIGQLVETFSTLASRKPGEGDAARGGRGGVPVPFRTVVEEAVVFQQLAHPDMVVHLHPGGETWDSPLDTVALTQVLNNVLLNAVQSVQERIRQGDPRPGQISLALRDEADARILVVEDNGIGLPAALRDRLTEPWVTTRIGGTGLGLAIVRTIMDQSGGYVTLSDREGGGAVVSLFFPKPHTVSGPEGVVS